MAVYIVSFREVSSWDSCSDFSYTYTIWHTSRQQLGRHFAEDIIKCIFLNENMYILFDTAIAIWPQVPINNTPALDEIMTRHRTGDKPSTKPIMVMLTDAYGASLGQDD